MKIANIQPQPNPVLNTFKKCSVPYNRLNPLPK